MVADKSKTSGLDVGVSALPDPDLDALDFTGDETSTDNSAGPQVGEPYDPRPQEDSARRTIAYLLIALLWLIVVGMLILLMFGVLKVTDMQEFAVLLGPVIALVSAATGFYYGTKSPGT